MSEQAKYDALRGIKATVITVVGCFELTQDGRILGPDMHNTPCTPDELMRCGEYVDPRTVRSLIRDGLANRGLLHSLKPTATGREISVTEPQPGDIEFVDDDGNPIPFTPFAYREMTDDDQRRHWDDVKALKAWVESIIK